MSKRPSKKKTAKKPRKKATKRAREEDVNEVTARVAKRAIDIGTGKRPPAFELRTKKGKRKKKR